MSQQQFNDATEVLKVAQANYEKNQKTVKLIGLIFIIGTIFLIFWRVDFGANRNEFNGNKSYIQESCPDCDQF